MRCRATAVLNCRVKTLKGMALELAGPDLARRELSLVSGTGSLMLVDSILAPSSPLADICRPCRQAPAWARVIVSAINALRMAGMTPDHLDPSCFDEPAKADDMRFSSGRVSGSSRRTNLIDYADVSRLAAHCMRDRDLKHTTILIPEDADLAPLELAFIETIPKTALHVLPVDQPARTSAEIEHDETDASVLRWLLAPTEAPDPLRDSTATGLSRERGNQRSARGTAPLHGSRVPAGPNRALHTDKQTYVPLIFETFCRMNQRRTRQALQFPQRLPKAFLPCMPNRVERLQRGFSGSGRIIPRPWLPA